jgi:mono/diheme cytochrome c family protein
MKYRLFIFLTLLAVALTACNLSLAEDITPPPGYQMPTSAPTLAAAVFPASAPNVDNGAAIYAEKCAPCHGVTGQGDGAQAANLPNGAPALGKAEFAFDKSPAHWYTVVTQGNMQNFMPPFVSLGDQERWDVVAYALSLGATAEQVQAGKALYEVNCVSCHGANGRLIPNADLASQERMAALSNQAIASLSQKGIPPAMPAADLSDADAAHLAAYLRTFTLASSGAVAATPAPSGAPETASTESAVPAAEATPAEQRGTISGLITNGSGGEIPAGLKAILHTFVHDLATQQFTEGEAREANVLAGGMYRFSDLPLRPTDAYYVSVEYGGITYESAAAIPSQGGLSEYDLPITIYETTTETADLAISTAHILLDYSQPGIIQVVEFFVFANMGNKTIVAAEAGKPVIEVPLPAGYQNLQFENGVLGERFLQTADGFGDTLPIPPTSGQNQYSVVFAFDMPYEADSSPLAFLGNKKFELAQKFNIKTGALNLLVPEGVKAEGANLTDGGTQNMGSGFTFQLYKAGAVESGQTFTTRVSGTPATTTAPTASQAGDSTRNIIIGVGAFGVVLILAGVFFYVRDRRAGTDEDDLEDEGEDEEELSEDDILDAIIALDDQYRAGNLSEEAYKERRAELKAKLRNA